MKIINCEQGSPEWFSARCGIPTASSFDKILDTSGKPSKQLKKYLYQLAGEKITAKQEETYINGAMQRGKEMEGEARKFYELTTSQKVVAVGFCLNETPDYGCSPDGLVDKEGTVEIKCPLMATHVGYLIEGVLPTDYFQQVQGGLLVTGRKWCDFISYYPGMKPLVVRVIPDKDFHSKLKLEVEVFCMELTDLIVKIK